MMRDLVGTVIQLVGPSDKTIHATFSEVCNPKTPELCEFINQWHLKGCRPPIPVSTRAFFKKTGPTRNQIGARLVYPNGQKAVLMIHRDDSATKEVVPLPDAICRIISKGWMVTMIPRPDRADPIEHEFLCRKY